MIELPQYLALRAIYGGLRMLSHSARIRLFEFLSRVVFAVLPRVKNVALRNLELAFPHESAEWRNELLKKNAREIGRLAADAVRLSDLDRAWVEAHVHFPIFEQYRARLAVNNGKGALIATGHLGSFELLGHTIGIIGYPLSAVARNFKNQRIDRWWKGLREARGNRIIGRKGAFKEMVASISGGMSTAVLFDQNVTRNHAIFVDWFGRPAATTRAVALAAIRTEAPVFVASLRHVTDDDYAIEAVECDFSALYKDETIEAEEKVRIITQEISNRYVEMIRSFPEGWFWFHRRWKTRPEGEQEGLYDG